MRATTLATERSYSASEAKTAWRKGWSAETDKNGPALIPLAVSPTECFPRAAPCPGGWLAPGCPAFGWLPERRYNRFLGDFAMDGGPGHARDASGWLMLQGMKIRPTPLLHATIDGRVLHGQKLVGSFSSLGGRGPVGRGPSEPDQVGLAHPRRDGSSPFRSLTPKAPAPGPPPLPTPR